MIEICFEASQRRGYNYKQSVTKQFFLSNVELVLNIKDQSNERNLKHNYSNSYNSN